MRTEKDCLGELELQDETLFGIHTKRSLDNFPVSGVSVNMDLIYAMVQVKKAACITNLSGRGGNLYPYECK